MTNHNLLIDNYIFYEKHHRNKLNILMHIICIPLLVWTYAFFLTYIPFEYSLNSESFYLKPLVFNYTSIVSLFYIIYYLYLDYNIGKKWIPIFLFICYTTKLYKILYPETALYNCIIVHIGSWIVQLLSHKFFEGNKPALLTGITQSFTIAPFFTLLEYLFMIGSRKDLYEKIQKRRKKDKIMEHIQLKKE